MCGLKSHEVEVERVFRRVTPFTGVWIEIAYQSPDGLVSDAVTPFTGVWIEIENLLPDQRAHRHVTPFTGVWIEMPKPPTIYGGIKSHPSRVCGLKSQGLGVCPAPGWSHPSRVCGLKSEGND